MEAPPIRGTHRGYGSSNLGPLTTTIFRSSSYIDEDHYYDPELDALLRNLEAGSDHQYSQFSLNDLYNESSNVSDVIDLSHNVMYCTGSQPQLYDPHPSFSEYDPFSFSEYEEAKHEQLLPYDAFIHDTSKLITTPRMHMHMHHQHMHNSENLELPGLEFPGSLVACGTIGTASPAHSGAAHSDSAAMVAPGMSTSTGVPSTWMASSLYWTFTPQLEITSLYIPPSIESTDGMSRVRFKVKTKVLDLDDGFQWKKYGQKTIKKEKYPRSYFKCDEVDRCKCTVVKRTQRCSDDQDCVLFTYLGRHNHPA